ncbi:hypothetical protein Bca4012_018448 [Brassica carinata]|uniref:Uncharacterized protein n=1 Tax=Brassica carinata TaxID=52824 RepID=A0A8X7WLI2_BRACI|nr:hypothetical protein Bca52824_003149 [Brassica carinata]
MRARDSGSSSDCMVSPLRLRTTKGKPEFESQLLGSRFRLDCVREAADNGSDLRDAGSSGLSYCLRWFLLTAALIVKLGVVSRTCLKVSTRGVCGGYGFRRWDHSDGGVPD